MNEIEITLEEIKNLMAKAAETTATYTYDPAARSVFSPENLDEEIRFLTPIDTPLRNRIPRTKGFGQAAVWKMMTSAIHGGMHPSTNVATGTATTIAFADAAAPSESTQTYSTSSATYKLLGRKLEVGGLALAASKGRDAQPDMQKSREKIKLYEVMIGEEELLIAGDAATRTSEFSGLNKQITTNSGNVTFLTASGVGSWCRTLYSYGADPTLLVASARQLEALKDDFERTGTIMQRVVSGAEVSGIVGGYALAKIVNPVTGTLIDCKPHRYVGHGGLLLTEKSPAGEVWMETDELIPMSRVDVPSAYFSYISFVLEAVALKLIGEPYQYVFNVGA